MACSHEDCPVVRECIKLVWMAATDAVVHPEYSQLLESSYTEMLRLSPCPGDGCLIQRAFPEAADQPLIKIFLRRIVSNSQTPDSVVQRVLRRTFIHVGEGIIVDAIAELSAGAHELDALEAMDTALKPE